MNMEKRHTGKNEKILELLKNESKTFEELKNGMGIDIEIRDNISHLLDTKKIKIIGISPGRRFAQKVLIFEAVGEDKYNLLDIKNVIDDNIHLNFKKGSKPLKELEELIDEKIRQMELEEESKWEKLLNSVIIRRPSEKEMVRELINKELMNSRENPDFLENEKYQGSPSKYRKLRREEYQNNKNLNLKLQKEINNYWVEEVDDVYIHWKTISKNKLSKKEVFNKVIAQEEFDIPTKMSPDQKKKLINDIIAYIQFENENLEFEMGNTTNASFKKDIRDLSYSLSDRSNSTKKFKRFIEYIRKKLNDINSFN